jgi:hypothetical protein
MPALKGVDDPQPGIRLFRIGREKERQGVFVTTTANRPRRKRRRPERAGAN